MTRLSGLKDRSSGVRRPEIGEQLASADSENSAAATDMERASTQPADYLLLVQGTLILTAY